MPRVISVSQIPGAGESDVVAVLPAFHTGIDDPRYGKDATEVYHNRSECQSAQKILADNNQTTGTGGRRLCSECRKYGPT